jgi:hypothetical protein
LKPLPFGSDLTLLFEQYKGQLTTIARKLCLQSFRHLRHKSLYVLLPVLGLMNNAHSRFNFFDNLAIEKLLSLIWTKGVKMHTQNRPISKKFLLPLHLFEPGSEKMGVFLKRKLKILSLV